MKEIKDVGGRPRILTPEEEKSLYKQYKVRKDKGVHVTEIAKKYNISLNTLYRTIKRERKKTK